MKTKDLLIISALRQDARKSLTHLSRETKIPISTIHDRLKSFKGNLIKKHTTLIDFSSLGFYTRATLLIKVEKGKREEVKKHLMSNQHVNSLYKINNGFDFMIDLVFKHIKDLEDYLESLEKRFEIIDQKIFYTIEELKRENFISNPKMVKLGYSPISTEAIKA